METSQYKELFISEGREILTALSNALVQLEKHPQEPELLNEIFRHAHTLKGMAASMGYDPITGLTHEMEEVLDLLRQGRLKADRKTADLLFQSLDALGTLVEDVARVDRAGESSPKPKVALQTLTGQWQKIRGGYVKRKGPPPQERRTNLRLEEADRREIVERAKEGWVTYRVAVSLVKGCAFKEPRALTVVKLLEGMGKVIRAAFLTRQFEGGRFGRHFGLFFMTQAPPQAIQAKAEAIPDVERVTLRPLETDELFLPEKPEGFIQEAGLRPKDERAGKQELLTVRVALDQLDDLMSVTGELVISRGRLTRLAQELEQKPLQEAVGQLGRLTDELQNRMMQMRLVPMEYIFNRFPRLVRDVAQAEGKQVDLAVEGAEIGLDRTILDKLNDPLIHLLRNAISHGIEPAAERKKAGKPPTGTVRLSARRERNLVVVEVADDGRGMQGQQIRQVAVRKRLIPEEEASKLSDEETLLLITLPGFSTAATVTETSGRGVGMNTVRTTVESFGGGLRIESAPGAGSTFTLTLPLTLAIVPALLVGVGGEGYAIPLANIVETVKIKADLIRQVEHHEVVPYREEVLPLIRLRERFGFVERSTLNAHGNRLSVVVVEIGHRKAGLVVDRLAGQQEVVIKMLTGALKNLKGVAGSTIFGDGKVGLIVDVASVL